jgi:cytochrome d ubiquinol oxidase subunit II
VLLGSSWLILKTGGALQKKAIAWARWGLLWVALGVALVSLATPLVSETVRHKWFDFPRTLWLMILPAMTIAAGAWIWISTGRLKRGGGASDGTPFLAAVAIFVLSFLGLAYSIYPYVVIDRLTIWDAANHPTALRFLFIGCAIVLPFIVAYTILAYRVFRGKTTEKLYD